MGIPQLNRYLLSNCSKHSIQKKQLDCFAGKTVVIDTSIYLYKYMGNDCLIENMYTMITIFKYYKIKPIFIFDGKPPDEKKDVMKQRYDDKQVASQKYADLLAIYEATTDEQEKNEIGIELEKLKRQFLRIRKDDVQNVKQLMDGCGVAYYDAPGEADQMCASMVIYKQAWACVSDDMDMFAYGCTRVMRHFSLLNHSVVFYNMTGILRELEIPMQDFRQILVMSGTDYNAGGGILANMMCKYEKYKMIKTSQTFYEWLGNNDIDKLTNINKMFVATKFQITPKHITYNPNKIFDILKPYGFIFV
jgi:flap endonuclease-1